MAITRRAKFYLAGYLAERRAAPLVYQPDNSRPDLAWARELIQRLTVDEPSLYMAEFEWLCREAYVLLVKHWSEVDAVARALLARGQLDGGEIYKIILATR